MNVKYVGPAKDYSGYGEATRHDIGALVAAEVPVTVFSPNYTLEISDFGDLGRLAVSLEGKQLDYDAIILHTTPNVYRQYMEPGKYHIARVFWETNKLPEDFIANIESCDEIWTGSQYNLQAIRNSGITKPIYIIPEAIDADIADKEYPGYLIDREQAIKSYKFYSLFEWTERKNPRALLTAYFLEFQGVEDVSLTLKTYIDNFTPDKKRLINEEIKSIKKSLNLSSYPKLYTYRQLMDRHQVYRFHNSFDCFVSAHRGEGWGIPQMEALLMGKPVISTNCGGIHEYLKQGEEALLVEYQLVPLTQNTRNQQWYASDQKWADVYIDKLRLAMRTAYQHRKQIMEMGQAGREAIKRQFALPVVGAIMKNRLSEIEQKMKA